MQPLVNVLETVHQDLTAHRVQRPGRNEVLHISFCKEKHSELISETAVPNS